MTNEEKVILNELKVIENYLDQMIEDCKLQLDPIGKFRFTRQDSGDPYIYQLETRRHKPHAGKWYPAGWFISYDKWEAKPYRVEKEIVIKGCYRTKNGDGWPDDVDIVHVENYKSLYEAFIRVIGDWFIEGISLGVSNGAEARMFAED